MYALAVTLPQVFFLTSLPIFQKVKTENRECVTWKCGKLCQYIGCQRKENLRALKEGAKPTEPKSTFLHTEKQLSSYTEQAE